MASATPAPTSLDALLERMPASNQPDVFPRELLAGDERVIYEARPSFLALYWGRTVFLGFWVVLAVAVAAVSLAAIPGGLLFVLIFGIPVWVALSSWWKTAYALSDRRVLRVSGLRGTDFVDASYRQVQTVAVERGFSGGLKFTVTRGLTGGFAASPTIGMKPEQIRWDGVPEPARVYEYVQEALAFGLGREQEQREVSAAWKGLGGGAPSITCQYCGSVIEIRSLDPADPRCPSCRAPIVGAPPPG